MSFEHDGTTFDVIGDADFEMATPDEEARLTATVHCHACSDCDGAGYRVVELHGIAAERAFDEHEGLMPGSSRLAAE
jgi:hypothetical protein